MFKNEFSIGVVICCITAIQSAFCQDKADTSFIEQYPQKIQLTGYLSRNSIEIDQDQKYYRPNSTLRIGLGISVKNTLINLSGDLGLVRLGSEKRGDTKSFDFQVQHYDRYLLLDLFYQQFRGFYQGNKDIVLYPNLSIKQVGAEGSYLLNGNKLSAKAAFGQSEVQLRSVGSFVLGGGMYLYKVKLDKDFIISSNTTIDNVQMGVNAGYAYSWVIDKHWLLSGLAKGGFNLGNEPQAVKNGKVDLFPTAFGQGSGVYHQSDWSLAFSFLIHNNSVQYERVKNLNLTSLNLGLSYVKHLDHLFKRKVIN